MLYRVQIAGIAPLILHNGDMANPLNPFARDLKAISGKRKKVEADYVEMARIEFNASLYLNSDRRVIIPATLLDAVIVSGAKKVKDGPTCKAACFVRDDAPLQFDGADKLPEELWADGAGENVFTAKAKVGQASVMRTRFKADTWAVDFDVDINEELVNEDQLRSWIEHAGLQCGLGTWRPRHGRFELVSIDRVDQAKAA